MLHISLSLSLSVSLSLSLCLVCVFLKYITGIIIFMLLVCSLIMALLVYDFVFRFTLCSVYV